MPGRGSSKVAKKTDQVAMRKRKAVDSQDGDESILDNQKVNKVSSSSAAKQKTLVKTPTKNKGKDEVKEKNKKEKQSVKESEELVTESSTKGVKARGQSEQTAVCATFIEHQDTVTITVDKDQENEFAEEGELSSDEELSESEHEVQFRNANENANVEIDDMNVQQYSASFEEEFNTPESRKFRELVAGDTFVLVKDMMEKSGLLQAATLISSQLGKQPEMTTARTDMHRKQKQHQAGVEAGEAAAGTGIPAQTGKSQSTIYENAVRDKTAMGPRGNPVTNSSNRFSSSSKEGFNSSGEIDNVVMNVEKAVQGDLDVCWSIHCRLSTKIHCHWANAGMLEGTNEISIST